MADAHSDRAVPPTPLPAWICGERDGDAICPFTKDHSRPHRFVHTYGPPGVNSVTGLPGCDGSCSEATRDQELQVEW